MLTRSGCVAFIIMLERDGVGLLNQFDANDAESSPPLKSSIFIDDGTRVSAVGDASDKSGFRAQVAPREVVALLQTNRSLGL